MNREEANQDELIFIKGVGYFHTDLLGIKMGDTGQCVEKDNNVPVKQPDPVTGLAPCGCGGKAVRNGMSFFYAYVTSCSECGTLAWSKSSQQEADNNWNVAMEYAAPKKEVVK